MTNTTEILGDEPLYDYTDYYDMLDIVDECLSILRLEDPFTRYVRLFVDGVLIILIAVIGIIFNLYGAVVNTRFMTKGPNSNLLSALISADSMLLLSVIVFHGIPSWLEAESVHNLCVTKLRIHSPFIVMAAMSFANYILVLVAYLRYLGIVQPLPVASQSLIVRWPTAAYFACMTWSIIVSIPRFFELELKKCWFISDDVDEIQFKHETNSTSMRLNKYYEIFYKIIFQSIFIHFIPFGLLCILSFRMHTAVRQAADRRHNLGFIQLHAPSAQAQMTSSRRGQRASKPVNRNRQIATSMILINVKFLITHLLPFLLNVIDLVYWGRHVNATWDQIATSMSTLLIVLNSATNTLVYTHWNREFTRIRRMLRSTSSHSPAPAGSLGALGRGDLIRLRFTSDERVSILTRTNEVDMAHIGREILCDLLAKSPGYGESLKNASFFHDCLSSTSSSHLVAELKDVGDTKGMCTLTQGIHAHGEQIGLALYHFIDCMMFCGPQQQTGCKHKDHIALMVEKHRKHVVRIDTSMWKDVKRVVLEHVLGMEEIQYRQALQQESSDVGDTVYGLFGKRNLLPAISAQDNLLPDIS